MLKKTDSENPPCFGKNYDRNSPCCEGGHDPTYRDPEDGSHIREECDHKSACAARTNLSKQTAPLIQANSLNRNQPSTTYAPAATSYQQHHSTHYAAQPPAPPWVNRQVTHAPPVGMAQMVQVNYGMPSYLTVREPGGTGSYMGRLMREMGRAIGKSIGHTIAHAFDVDTWSGNPPPGNNTSQ